MKIKSLLSVVNSFCGGANFLSDRSHETLLTIYRMTFGADRDQLSFFKSVLLR